MGQKIKAYSGKAREAKSPFKPPAWHRSNNEKSGGMIWDSIKGQGLVDEVHL